MATNAIYTTPGGTIQLAIAGEKEVACRVSSAERTQAMRPWLHGYNRHRPHSALGGKPPLSRLPEDNLHSNDI